MLFRSEMKAHRANRQAGRLGVLPFASEARLEGLAYGVGEALFDRVGDAFCTRDVGCAARRSLYAFAIDDLQFGGWRQTAGRFDDDH